MYGKIQEHLASELAQIEANGLLKKERIIITPQGANVKVSTGEEVVIMCANNYLGLSSHPEVVHAAKDALDTHGYGMSSVRFICGTQDIHKTLERKIAEFYGTEDTILYAAAFDANGGLFEPLLLMKTQLYQMNSIMHPLLMEYVCARLLATAISIPTWQTGRYNCN